MIFPRVASGLLATALMAGAVQAQAPAGDNPPSSTTVRQVAPGFIVAPASEPDRLERVPARGPLSTFASPLPKRKAEPKPLLHRPVAVAAGIIEAGGRVITIAGVVPLTDDETCQRTGADDAWPCGRAARTAFRAMLRGRAVTCDLPDGEVPDSFTTSCRIGARDLGEWLAANGWAHPSGERYADLSRSARDARKGIFGAGPSSLPPDTFTQPVAAPDGPLPTLLSDDISILADPSEDAADAAEAMEAPTTTTDAGGSPVPVSPLPAPSSPRQ